MAKSLPKWILDRMRGRQQERKDAAGEAALSGRKPAVTGVIPDDELPVQHRDAFMLLARSINMADSLGIKASTRRAALAGMTTLAEVDPGRMAAILDEAGAHGMVSLKTAILELAGYGRARVSA